MTIEPALLSLFSAVVYVLGCRRFGCVFPFNEYHFYSDTSDRATSATPVFLAEGEVTDPSKFHRFTGFEDFDFLPATMPTGLSWVALETGRWISQHSWDGEPGSVRVQYGYIEFTASPYGSIEQSLTLLCEGNAWRH